MDDAPLGVGPAGPPGPRAHAAMPRPPGRLTAQIVHRVYGALLERFVRSFYPRVCDREDLYNEVFKVVLQKLPALEADAQVEAWLYAITKNVARNYFRGLAKDGTEFDEQVLSGPLGDADAQVTACESLDALRKLVAALKEEERFVFIAHDVDRMSLAEIAASTGVPLGTVGSRLTKARTFVRERMRAREGEKRPPPEETDP